MSNVFRFKRLDTVGNPSAESDSSFLSTCFIDNGELDILRDCGNEQSIVVGRTGAGKTALLKTLVDKEERTIVIDPHELACGYISNSTVLKFFESLNIKMDLFYRLLWKHIFIVEILKKHFDLYSEEDKIKAFDEVRYNILRKKAHLEAFEYLNTWGTTFWETTEDRIKEITKKIETDLKASADISIHDFIKMGVEGSKHLSEEQRREITQRGQEVINKVQMSKLSSLFNALDEEILTKPQKRYFIIIDRLDEDWVDDFTRYRLIRALIETTRELNSKVRFAKVVIALRADLLDRVLRATTDSGFQDEKYRGLCLPIYWNRSELTNLLDARISELVRHRYTNQLVTHGDLLPKSIGVKKEVTINYMLDRTLLRPRDVITFFNCCVSNAEDEPKIKVEQLLNAEGQYSHLRMRSLADEWSIHYPYLTSICNLLKKRTPSFKLMEIEDEDLLELCIDVLGSEPTRVSEDVERINIYYNSSSKNKAKILRAWVAEILYKVGIVGLKTDPFKGVAWSNNGMDIISSVDIDDDTVIQIHKMVWRELGIAS